MDKELGSKNYWIFFFLVVIFVIVFFVKSCDQDDDRRDDKPVREVAAFRFNESGEVVLTKDNGEPLIFEECKGQQSLQMKEDLEVCPNRDPRFRKIAEIDFVVELTEHKRKVGSVECCISTTSPGLGGKICDTFPGNNCPPRWWKK